MKKEMLKGVQYHYCTSFKEFLNFKSSVLSFLKQKRQQHKPIYIASDIETSGFSYYENKLITSGLDFLNGYILCVSFSFQKRHAWVIPFTQEKGKPLWTYKKIIKILMFLKNLYEYPSICWVGHNFKFDLRFLHRIGTGLCRYCVTKDWDALTKQQQRSLRQYDIDVFKMHKIFDTMIGAHLINENQPMGLKELIKQKTDMGDYEKHIVEFFNKT